ncbi:MAG: ribonuclease P protein component [Pseudonocardiaceae bacterium]|nr:ribonuclease P protein component [Pseudonocardiaceae bacterium]
MLPPDARLTRRADFATALRRGRRATPGRLVAHLAHCDGDRSHGARVGFVVSRSVGGAVVRHRVQRKLRHLVRDRLGRLPAGTLLVVRALPPAAAASSAVLGRDLDSALDRLLDRGRILDRDGRS